MDVGGGWGMGAGVMSAFGLLVSPLAFELSRSQPTFLADLDGTGFADSFQPLMEEAAGFLRRAGTAEDDIRLICRLAMRYQGQGYDIEVVLPEGRDLKDAFAELPALFRAAYAQTFSVSLLDEPLEIVAWKVEARGPEAALRGGYNLLEPSDSAAGAEKGARRGPLAPTLLLRGEPYGI